LSADEKLTLIGRVLGHATYVEILGPIYIFGTVEDRNFIFDALIEHNVF